MTVPVHWKKWIYYPQLTFIAAFKKCENADSGNMVLQNPDFAHYVYIWKECKKIK